MAGTLAADDVMDDEIPAGTVLVAAFYERGVGRVPPPYSLTAMCSPSVVPGFLRTLSKLNQSRGWVAKVTTDAVWADER